MKKSVLFFGFSLVIVLSACKHEPTPPVIDESSIPSGICFKDQIQPLINSNCAMQSCHGGSQDPALVTYDDIMHLVTSGDPQSSRLYKMAIGSSMPPSPRTPMNLEQVTLIYGWIKQGALNNSCNCDTNNYRFSADILPIIHTFCTGCHSGATPSGDLTLQTYTDVVNADNLYQRITNSADPMPPTGLMDSCRITEIKKWIAAGKPNN